MRQIEFLNEETFKQKVFNWEKHQDWVYEGDVPAIIDFYADWCQPCKIIAPILEELQQEYGDKIQVYKVDTEAHPRLAAMFGIRNIPSLLFIPVNGMPQMAVGALPKDVLKQAIKDVLGVDEPAVVDNK